MANVTKAVLEEENKTLKEEKQRLDDKYNKLENELSDIKSLLLQNKGSSSLEQALTQIVDQQQQNTAPISVGSLDVNGVTIIIDGRDERVTKPVSLSLEGVHSILKTPRNRKLFENGILYFSDDKWYDYFRISRSKILNDENIIQVFNGDNEDIKYRLDQLTDSKSSLSSMYQLPFKITILLTEKKLSIDLDQLEIVERYFGYSLNSIKAQLKYLNSI